jgi:uncharacterized membrane protein
MRLAPLNILTLYGITAVSFFIIDLIWIAGVAKTFYARTIGGMMRDQVNWPAAILFYGIYIGGIVVFVLLPSLKEASSLSRVAILGALLGLFAYGTFDLTALALFKDWPVSVTLVDMLWGTVLTAGAATLSMWIARNFLGH